MDKSVFAGTGVFASIERNLVVLSNELCGWPIEDAMWVVAHELAHLYLGHVEPRGSKRDARPEEAEPDAVRLAASWGFEPEWVKSRRR
jgi:Zn-dependent peptidase ImmA (M78 family)